MPFSSAIDQRVSPAVTTRDDADAAGTSAAAGAASGTAVDASLAGGVRAMRSPGWMMLDQSSPFQASTSAVARPQRAAIALIVSPSATTSSLGAVCRARDVGIGGGTVTARRSARCGSGVPGAAEAGAAASASDTEPTRAVVAVTPRRMRAGVGRKNLPLLSTRPRCHGTCRVSTEVINGAGVTCVMCVHSPRRARRPAMVR